MSHVKMELNTFASQKITDRMQPAEQLPYRTAMNNKRATWMRRISYSPTYPLVTRRFLRMQHDFQNHHGIYLPTEWSR